MCGIAGFLLPGQRLADAQAVVDRMAERLRHRGPDDSGAWIDAEAGVALGHRRLSVIDVSPLGHQPMLSTSGRYTAVFNGEIYNHREIAEELRAGGAVFRGHSDTEVMLRLFDEVGIERALPRLSGQFAIAVWDGRERLLHLVRDRLGEKPLYYARVDGGWVFGSELRALRAHPAFTSVVDPTVLPLFLRHGYVPAPHAIYRGTRKVRPGACVVLQEGQEAQERPYWTVLEAAARGLADPLPAEPETVIEELDRALGRTIRQAMIADVPLGAFLSGGVDSSLITSLMCAASAAPVRTFTIGVREPGFDEAAHAGAVASHLGTEHTVEYVTPEHALEIVPRLAELYDEPFADSSQIPTYLVAATARKHVTVALSGDGGDELFGGYDRYRWGLRIRRARRGLGPVRYPLARLLRAGAALPGRVGGRAQRLAGMMAAVDDPELYREIVSGWRDPESAVVEPEAATTALASVPATLRDSPWLERMMYWDTVTYLPDDILVKVDRAAMAVSLETRVPYLDHRIVELAWRIPASLKWRDGVGKWVLRRLLDRYVPRTLTERPKRGFSVPVDAWLRGPLREWAGDLLTAERIGRQGFFRPERITDVWSAHLSGRRSHGYLLWPVLIFGAWLDHA
jgi:asparagine synthase (glutamine-hydrolysing)